MSERYTDEEIKKEILAKLWRRGLFGGKYQPKEKVMSSIPKNVRGEAEKLIGEMRKDGLLIYHKRQKCISLNPKYKEKIKRILEDHLPDYYFS